MPIAQHELLAIKNGQQAKWTSLSTQHKDKFQKKTDYRRFSMIFEPVGEGQPPIDETTPEQSTLKSTVRADLAFLYDEIFGNLVDTAFRVNVTNTTAKADVVVDGKTVFTNVPVIALLELEKQLQEWRKVVDTTPQLEDRGFIPDTSQISGVYKAKDVRKARTKKVTVPLVLAPATDKHPAQVKEGYEDLPVGTVK